MKTTCMKSWSGIFFPIADYDPFFSGVGSSYYKSLISPLVLIFFCKLTVVIICTTLIEENSHHTQTQNSTTTLAVRCVYKNIECLHPVIEGNA